MGLDMDFNCMYHSDMNKTAVRRRGARSRMVSDQVMFSLMCAARVVEDRLEAALAEIGLSGAKYSALAHLVRAGEPLSLGECAARMTCVRSNMTQLIDRLEGDGLVQRVHDPVDRRSVKAALTPLGMERYAAGAKRVEQVQKKFDSMLSSSDRAALARALAALTE
jgi:DNA-binding MarR family transcriptional regulator